MLIACVHQIAKGLGMSMAQTLRDEHSGLILTHYSEACYSDAYCTIRNIIYSELILFLFVFFLPTAKPQTSEPTPIEQALDQIWSTL